MPVLAALAALALLGVRRLLLIVTVEGTSMAPTYAPGRRLLVLRTPLARVLVRPGAVVVFRLPRTGPDRTAHRRHGTRRRPGGPAGRGRLSPRVTESSVKKESP